MRFTSSDDWNDAFIKLITFCLFGWMMSFFLNRSPWFSCNYACVLKSRRIFDGRDSKIRKYFSGNPVLWCICFMYLIDRFSQLIRCLVPLHFKNTWDINDLTLNYYKKATSTTPLTLRMCHGCVYTGTFVLDIHALYLQHFMCIEYTNPMSSFSGTGRSTNSQCRLKGFVTV